MGRFERNHLKNKTSSKKKELKEKLFNKNNNSKSRKKKKILIISTTIFIIILLFGGIFTGLLQDPTGFIKFQNQFNDGKVTILIVGSDVRPYENQARSDAIIVGNFDFKKGTANLLSIPRDTRVNIQNHGEDKINHSYAFGGIEFAQKTIEDFLNIKIDRYVEINFESFKTAVDQLGGIEINVEEDMYYPEEGIDLNAGKQILNGADTLAYVRFRGTPMGDLGRVDRHQKFILALFSAIKTKSNIFQQVNTFGSFLKNMRTNITLQESLYMFSKYKDANNFIISTWISSGTPEMIQGVSYIIPSYDASRENIQFLKGQLIAVNDPYETGKKILVSPEEKENVEKIKK